MPKILLLGNIEKLKYRKFKARSNFVLGSGKGFLCGLGLGEIEGGWSGFGAGGTAHVGQRVVRDLLVSLWSGICWSV